MNRFAIGMLVAWTTLLPAVAAADAPGAASVSLVVRGNNQFAFDLHGQLAGRKGNLFFSPYSISTALAMTSAGARGRTLEEMLTTLHLPSDSNQLHAGLAELHKQIHGEQGKAYQLRTANRLWGQKGHGFLPAFLGQLERQFGAGLAEVDFQEATEEARQTINGWVAKETQDKIQNLIAQGILNANTKLVLTNAIYFKGDWVHQFKKNRTHNGMFFSGGEKQQTIPLMNQNAVLGYVDGGTFQLLEMPYVGREISMVVLLPKQRDGLVELEKKLNADMLAGWLTKLKEEDVQVTLPRFKMTEGFDAASALQKLGMVLPFTNTADFSGMSSKGSLSIAAVIHKAFVDVNETGTEAAAATAVVVATPGPVVRRPVFRADHPFVFLIRDNRSNSILFMGRLAEPR
jgi:serpin B